MIELALATVALVELIKHLVPPLQTWAKPIIAGAVVAVGAALLGLGPLAGIGAWGLSHGIHAAVRLALAVSDYYRVESVLRTRRRG